MAADMTPRAPDSDILNDLHNHVLASDFSFNQMGAKAGVKLYGDRAVNAIVSEYKQLNDRMAFKPRAVAHLTKMKLKRMLCFLNGTITMPLTLSIDSMSIMKTWVDASYAIHANMRSHTGGTIMMGLGLLYGKSSAQKINVKSSTEAELRNTALLVLTTDNALQL
jgi:hypothetical protein